MIKIYSKTHPSKKHLLHIIVGSDDFLEQERTDLVSENEYIQCSKLHMNQGKTFRPHMHIWKRGEEKVIAQESWVVIRGSVLVQFYDIDGSSLKNYVLKAGDVSFTLEGGHNYEILEDDTMVYEFKIGPYTGQQNDKVFI